MKTGLFCFLYFLSSFSYADESAYKVSENDVAFFKSIQSAVSQDRRAWLAEHFSYPLCLKSQGRIIVVKKSSDFIKNYRLIVPLDVQQRIENQSPEHLFVNWQGVMAADGALWFILDGSRYLISAINSRYRVECNQNAFGVGEPE